MLKHKSISKRLTFSISLAVAIIAILSIASIYFTTANRAWTELDQKTDTILADLIKILETPVWNTDIDSVQTIGKTAIQNEIIDVLEIKDLFNKNKPMFSYFRERNVQRITRSGKIFLNGELIGEVNLAVTTHF